jgi:hypothetical protein
MVTDFRFPEPEFTFVKIELSEIHEDDDEDEPDRTIITAENDKSQNCRPNTETLVDAVTVDITGNADVIETESKDIKKETDDARVATVKI